MGITLNLASKGNPVTFAKMPAVYAPLIATLDASPKSKSIRGTQILVNAGYEFQTISFSFSPPMSAPARGLL